MKSATGSVNLLIYCILWCGAVRCGARFAARVRHDLSHEKRLTPPRNPSTLFFVFLFLFHLFRTWEFVQRIYVRCALRIRNKAWLHGYRFEYTRYPAKYLVVAYGPQRVASSTWSAFSYAYETAKPSAVHCLKLFRACINRLDNLFGGSSSNNNLHTTRNMFI